MARFDDDGQFVPEDKVKYEVLVRMYVWADDPDAAEQSAKDLIDEGKLILIDNEQDFLDEYDIEDISAAPL